MWPLDVAIDGGRFLLVRLIDKFGYAANYTFLIAWMSVDSFPGLSQEWADPSPGLIYEWSDSP